MKKRTPKSPPRRWPFLVLFLGVVLACLAGMAGLFLASRQNSAPPSPSPPLSEIRNVVLISIDTCRPDRLGCYGEKRPTTPNIDAIARTGARFDQALSPVALTLPAHSSMLIGTYPPTHGVHLNNGEFLDPSNLTLAEILTDAGYETGAFVAGFPLDAQFGLNQGFGTYDGDFTKKNAKTAEVPQRRADAVCRPALEWLNRRGKNPFFLFLHFYDPHQPYDLPPEYADQFADDPYTAEIALVDRWIGELTNRLRELDLDEKTLIIITADHGESIGEHGEETHGFFAYQSTLRVPLIIRVPRAIDRGVQIKDNVSLVDLVPTILDLLGHESPANLQGISLRNCLEGKSPPERRHPIYFESLTPAVFGCGRLVGIVDGAWKYIRAPRRELYDLAEDPMEERNLIEKEAPRARTMHDRLEALLRQLEEVPRQSTPAAVDPRAVARLRTLGYVGGSVAPSGSAFDPTLEDPKDFLPTYDRLRVIQTMFSAGKNAEADRECAELLARRPSLIAAHRQRLAIAMEERRIDDARRHVAAIQAVLDAPRPAGKQLPTAEIITQRVNCHIALGDILFLEKKMEESAAEYEKAVAIDPFSTLALGNLGVALRERGKVDEAIDCYAKVLQINPNDATTRNNLGVALRGKGRLVEAQESFEKAIAINPDYRDAVANLASVLKELGKLDKAIAQFRKVLMIDAKFAPAHNDLGTSLQKQGKSEEAVASFRKAIEIDPRYLEAHFNLGVALESQGKLADAIAEYRETVQIDPRFGAGMKHLATALARGGLRDEAIATLEVAIELHPDDADAHYVLGSLLRDQGKFPQAVAQWRAALRGRPDDVVLLNDLAYLLATSPDAEVRNGKEAVELAKKCAALPGGDVPELMETLAAAHAEAGDFPAAVRVAERALELAKSTRKGELANLLEQRLDLYRSNQPFRELPPGAAPDGFQRLTP